MEITTKLNLDDEQSKMIEMHSFLNVLNILISEMYLIQLNISENDNTQNYKRIGDAIAIVLSFSQMLREPELIVKELSDAEGIKNDLLNCVKDAVNGLDDNDEIKESYENILSIMSIFMVRSRELLTRFGKGDIWVYHDIANLKNNFVNVFAAIEKNSKGRYKIIYNIAEHDEGDYFVQLDIRSVDNDRIFMPPVFQDVMRDLIANARKYTNPGGKIIAGLIDDGEFLKFVVEDTGRGIPASQISKVVEYGFRADNVADHETKGGGFGLTKAYRVAKNFNGKMFIESELDKGTTIKIELPKKN